MPIPSSQWLDIRACRKALLWLGGERGFGNPHCSSGHRMGLGSRRGHLGQGTHGRGGAEMEAVMGCRDGGNGG